MSDIEKSLGQILELYKAAVLAKDAEAFIRLYDPSVRVFDTWGVWSYEGAEAWQRAVEGWFTSLGAERCKVSFEDVKMSIGKEFSILSAIVTYAAIAPSGEALRSMQNRISWGLKTSGHMPRIVHEHTSAPVGFEDMKAMLQRPGKG
ncbi:MAG TPA: nuclear transport factor 2 family protein [Burkholderiaceae bacterium]